jgi:tetratricopeptide (TPR) repeat protein
MRVLPAQASETTPIQAIRAAALGSVLGALEAGKLAAAEAQAASWIARDPDDIEAMLLLGLAIAAQGDAVRAAPLLVRVAAARPNFAHPCLDVARMRPDEPRIVAALFRACRAIVPNDQKLGYAYGNFLLDTGNPAAAAAVLRELVTAAPAFGPAHNLFGMALVELGDMTAAIAEFNRAAILDPEEGAVWANLGMALKIEGRFDEAIAAHDRAVLCAPNDPRLRLNRAVTYLRAGRMSEAWPDFESRLASPRGLKLPMEKLLPSVDGVDLRGRTVLAWHEEGFGDTLHFGRYLPLLAERGAMVLVRLPADLHRLFASMPGVTVVDERAALPAFDWHIPVFSLPRAFDTTLATIPAQIPYLQPAAALVASWGHRLSQALPPGKLRVGLVWAGQARPWLPWFTTLDGRRSMSLASMAPLGAVPGIALVCLQKGPAADEARTPPAGMVLHNPMASVIDFADTAAIVANLDLVVSVDTSMVHLAGAVGGRVLMLDRYDSCWRWLSGRDDSPWYPKLRIVRQTVPGDWDAVVHRAAVLIAEMAASRGA